MPRDYIAQEKDMRRLIVVVAVLVTLYTMGAAVWGYYCTPMSDVAYVRHNVWTGTDTYYNSRNVPIGHKGLADVNIHWAKTQGKDD